MMAVSSLLSRWKERTAVSRRSARSQTCSGGHQCKRSSLRSAVELRPEESRSRLQNLISPSKFEVLPFQLFEPQSLIRTPAGLASTVDVGLTDPVTHRLSMHPKLFAHFVQTAIRPVPGVTPLVNEPHRPLPKLDWISSLSSHGLHPLSYWWSLHGTRGGSCLPTGTYVPFVGCIFRLVYIPYLRAA